MPNASQQRWLKTHPKPGPHFRTMRVRGAAVLQAPGSTPSHPSKFSLRGPKGCMSLPGPGGSVTMSLLLSSPSATWVRRANPRLRAGGALDGGAETLSHPEEEDRGPVGTPPQAAMRVRSGLLWGGHVCFSTSCHPQFRYLLSPSIPVFFPRRGHSMPCLTPSREGK